MTSLPTTRTPVQVPADFPAHLRAVATDFVNACDGLPRGDDILRADLAKLDDEDAAIFIADMFFPMAAAVSLDRFTEERDRLLARRFNAIQTQKIMTAYIRLGCSSQVTSAGWLRNADINLGYLLDEGFSTQMFGSLVRSFAWFGWHSQDQFAFWTVSGVLKDGSSYPLPVKARCALLSADAQRRGSFLWDKMSPDAQHRLHQEINVGYPDLAGLPYDLAVDLVASQPIPAEWFVNVWDVPEPLQQIPAISSHPLWDELTELRA